MIRVYDHYSDVNPENWHWPKFKPKEIACKGTGRLVVDYDAMDKLQALRTELKRPIIINSAYRSPGHNAKIGGVKNSMHTFGKAFDIKLTISREDIKAAAKKVGFTGIGDYNEFVHVDTGPNRYWDKRKV